MSFAPQRDWDFYRSVASQHDAFIARTAAERLRIYTDFFDTVSEARIGHPRSSELDRQRWEEKLAIRRRCVAAFHALDRWNCETNAADRSL